MCCSCRRNSYVRQVWQRVHPRALVPQKVLQPEVRQTTSNRLLPSAKKPRSVKVLLVGRVLQLVASLLTSRRVVLQRNLTDVDPRLLQQLQRWLLTRQFQQKRPLFKTQETRFKVFSECDPVSRPLLVPMVFKCWKMKKTFVYKVLSGLFSVP